MEFMGAPNIDFDSARTVQSVVKHTQNPFIREENLFKIIFPPYFL